MVEDYHFQWRAIFSDMVWTSESRSVVLWPALAGSVEFVCVSGYYCRLREGFFVLCVAFDGLAWILT